MPAVALNLKSTGSNIYKSNAIKFTSKYIVISILIVSFMMHSQVIVTLLLDLAKITHQADGVDVRVTE